MSTVKAKGMSEADADRLIEVLKKAGATDIEKIKENGTYSVIFTEPDDD